MKDLSLVTLIEIPIQEFLYIRADGKMAVRLQTEPLSPASQKKAEIELRETPDRVQESIEELRRLLKDDDKMYFDTNEEYLKIFLRPTKYYPESAYKLMKRVADFRKHHAVMLEHVLPSVEKDILFTTRVLNVLVDRDQDGRRVLIMNLGKLWNPDIVTTDRLFRILYLIHMGASMEPETQVSGAVLILDFTGLGMKQVRAFSPSFSYKLLSFIQDAMPLRLKQIHIIFQPMIFKLIWQIFKPFIGEKLEKRVFFHGSNMKSLHKQMDPEYLPEDYGGRKPKINYSSADWCPVFESLEDKIKEWNTYGYVQK